MLLRPRAVPIMRAKDYIESFLPLFVAVNVLGIPRP
jgi:hypothetical protein